VIRSHYGHGFLKQYVRDDRLLRTEAATNGVYNCNVNKNIEHLPALHQKMSGTVDNYHDAQQDIPETFVDRGQFRKLAEPTVLPNAKRICLVFLKLFRRIYAPLTCGLLAPFSGDKRLATEKHSQIDRLYARVTHDHDELTRAVGLKIAA